MTIKKVEVIPIKDFPPNVEKELSRLHDVIADNGGSANEQMRNWAMAKIDKIHEVFFNSVNSVGYYQEQDNEQN